MERILITGAAGALAQLVVPRLRQLDRHLRLLDIAPLSHWADHDDAELVNASILDGPAMLSACRGMSALVHLAGGTLDGDWSTVRHVNIDGTQSVLDAARRAGVRRVVLASSNHVVGFHPRASEPAPDNLPPRPDTYYGVSKAALEALGSLYHDRYGMDVICLRIGSCTERPRNRRALSTWLSPDDCARLINAALSAPDPGFRIVWGVSANHRQAFSLREAARIGYEPQDDAERWAADLQATSSEDDDLGDRYIGGGFCSPDFDDNFPAPSGQPAQAAER